MEHRMGGRRERLAAAVQLQVGTAIRSRVAGPDADARALRIWGAPGPRWFPADDPVARVHADASMFVGGITALLLQSLHPLAMAGVAGHSGYKSDPWGRVERTSEYIAMTTFGPIPSAEELIARIRGIHDRVRGKDYRGRPYRAGDPHLLRWVHLAETWAFLQTHTLYSAHPLSAADADTYVDHTRRPSEMLGAADLPRTVGELSAALEGYRPELETSPDAVETARFLLRHPPLTGSARAGYGLLAAGAVAALPAWAASMLHLTTHPVPHHLQLLTGRMATRIVAWGLESVRDDRLFNRSDDRPSSE